MDAGAINYSTHHSPLCVARSWRRRSKSWAGASGLQRTAPRSSACWGSAPMRTWSEALSAPSTQGMCRACF